jgi:hypothetical protein
MWWLTSSTFSSWMPASVQPKTLSPKQSRGRLIAQKKQTLWLGGEKRQQLLPFLQPKKPKKTQIAFQQKNKTHQFQQEKR